MGGPDTPGTVLEQTSLHLPVKAPEVKAATRISLTESSGPHHKHQNIMFVPSYRLGVKMKKNNNSKSYTRALEINEVIYEIVWAPWETKCGT